MPYILVVGRGLERGMVEIKNSTTGEGVEVEVDRAVSVLNELVCRVLEELEMAIRGYPYSR